MWPTQDCPEHQAVPQDGAEHDEAEGHGPHGVRQFALGIVYKGIINRKQVSPRNDTNFSFKMFSFFLFPSFYQMNLRNFAGEVSWN